MHLSLRSRSCYGELHFKRYQRLAAYNRALLYHVTTMFCDV